MPPTRTRSHTSPGCRPQSSEDNLPKSASKTQGSGPPLTLQGQGVWRPGLCPHGLPPGSPLPAELPAFPHPPTQLGSGAEPLGSGSGFGGLGSHWRGAPGTADVALRAWGLGERMREKKVAARLKDLPEVGAGRERRRPGLGGRGRVWRAWAVQAWAGDLPGAPGRRSRVGPGCQAPPLIPDARGHRSPGLQAGNPAPPHPPPTSSLLRSGLASAGRQGFAPRRAGESRGGF